MTRYYIFLYLFLVNANAALNLDAAIKPVNEITAALIGQVLVVVATLALMAIGFAYFFGENDEAQKKKLVNWFKGGAIVLTASSVAAMWG